MSKYDRDVSNPKEGSDKVTVGSLLKEGADESQVRGILKDKFGNDKELVEKMFAEWEEQNARVKRKAKKFAELILTRYNHLGPKRILEKAQKLKKKYGFSDDEFQAFVNIALSDKALSHVNVYNSPNTPMGKTLGQMDATLSKMSVKATETDVLQDILRMHQESAVLHNQVVVQSLTYGDASLEAISGIYDPTKQNKLNHVHPVLAALFFPRVKYLDEHMLIASLPSIVASRHNNAPIKDRPTYELYWDIITDPNEISCVNSKDSPLVDLRNRSRVQVELWKSVKNLRQGKYYEADSMGFLMALSQCRNYIFDSADNIYNNDEGSILRKLLSVFSVRPTIVSIQPFGSYTQALNYPVNTMALTQVTTIPIINIRLPPTNTTVNTMNLTGQPQAVNISLNDGLTHSDWYVENKVLVPKMKSVMYSREVVFFYVNRRLQNVQFQKLVSPYSFSLLPISSSGFESINRLVVDVPMSGLQIGDSLFSLKSFVKVETAQIVQSDYINDLINKDLIIGCSTSVVASGKFFSYNPLRAQTAGQMTLAGVGTTPDQVPYVTPITAYAGSDEFNKDARENGTVFMFVKSNDSVSVRAALPATPAAPAAPAAAAAAPAP